MSAFEDFVQTELPKRPYTDTDPAVESIMIRRGLGPRQTVGIQLTTDGHVPVYKNGSIVASTVDAEVTSIDGGFY